MPCKIALMLMLLFYDVRGMHEGVCAKPTETGAGPFLQGAQLPQGASLGLLQQAASPAAQSALLALLMS